MKTSNREWLLERVGKWCSAFEQRRHDRVYLHLSPCASHVLVEWP